MGGTALSGCLERILSPVRPMTPATEKTTRKTHFSLSGSPSVPSTTMPTRKATARPKTTSMEFLLAKNLPRILRGTILAIHPVQMFVDTERTAVDTAKTTSTPVRACPRWNTRGTRPSSGVIILPAAAQRTVDRRWCVIRLVTRAPRG